MMRNVFSKIFILLFFIFLIVHGVNAANFTAKDWTDQGQFYSSQNNFLDALDAFDKALALDQTYASAWAGKSNALGNLGRLLEALDAANTAISLDSNFAMGWTAKGNALTGLKRFQEGLDAFNKALTLDPNLPPAWTGKGNVLTGLSRYQEALDAYNTALSIDPGFVPALNNKKKLTDKLGATEFTKLNGTVTSVTSEATPAPPGGAEPAIPILPMTIILIIFVCAGGIFVFYQFRKKRESSEEATHSMKMGEVPDKSFSDKGIPPESANAGIQPGETPPHKKARHHDVFISYSHNDKPVADAICAQLEAKAMRCWIAPRDVLPGENFPDAIIRAIEESPVMVLVFSASSNNSQHVMRELTKAISKGVVIIPFRIERVPLSRSMEYLIGLPHWLDALSQPMEAHIEKLAQTIHILLERSL